MAKQKWAPGRGGKDGHGPEIAGGGHFAARERRPGLARMMRALPDPDPVLKKMGRGIAALEDLLSDSHLESVWSVRCAAASGAEWFVAPGDDGSAAGEVADAFAAELHGLDVPRIVEEMMDAVAYGYSPLEILWTARDGRWGFSDIVGKPPQWFEFDPENRLVLKQGIAGTEELPPNRFLLVRHRPSYVNPYGTKVFSKCYWPVTFKRNGFRWWTAFVEKYGGAFMYGKYPPNAGDRFKQELLDALERMVADSVAIAPDGTDITITQAGDKGGSSEVHSSYIQMANNEISKAVLGQTLTTEIGDSGSFAAAKAHNMVREDLASADRRRIGAAFDGLARIYALHNFGPDAAAPSFQFVKDEDLQTERAGRDSQMYAFGWRPGKEYFIRQYGLQEDEFEVQETGGGGMFGGFASGTPFKRPSEGIETFASGHKKPGAGKLLAEFAEEQMVKGQNELDRLVEVYVDALGRVDNYEDAIAAIAKTVSGGDYSGLAGRIAEVRYAAQVLGERNG